MSWHTRKSMQASGAWIGLAMAAALALAGCDTELFATYTPTPDPSPTFDRTPVPVVTEVRTFTPEPTTGTPIDATDAPTEVPTEEASQPTPSAIPQVAASPPTCTPRWFMTPLPEMCPASPPLDSFGTMQRFERGLMIYVQALQQIYVFYGDLTQPTSFDVFPDPYEAGVTPRRDADIVPSRGFFQPELGFGAVWRGAYDDQLETPVRDALGWALSEDETGYQARYQCGAPVSAAPCFLKRSDGRILVMAGDFASLWPPQGGE